MTIPVKQGSVVVGVDGSTGSDPALRWATRHAAAWRRPLHILNGAGDPAYYTAYLEPAEGRRLLRAQAQRITDEALATAQLEAPNLDIEVTAPLQDARDALIDSSTHASIVVIGKRGRGPVRSLLLGSVSTAVAEHASCPVAVVRPDGDVPSEAHVVVGTDGGPASTAAIEFAFDLASTEGRVLDVVHSWSPYDEFVDAASYSQRLELMREHERMLGESLAGYAEKYPDVVVSRHLPNATAAQTLIDKSNKASAVVIGSRGRTGAKVLMGSVSRSVVERAHCTVIVVRP